jgi:hypothetical protein
MCLEPRVARAFSLLLSVPATTALLSACVMRVPPVAAVAPPPPPLNVQVAAQPAPPPAAQAPAPAPAPAPSVVTPVQGGLPGAVVADSRITIAAVLTQAERLRRLTPPELAQEMARLADIPELQRQPADDIQLALALAQTRVPADLVRAQVVLQRLLANPREEARALQPLASLLLARYTEQRRVEDQVDKQSQQLKEQKQRIDQLNERLEAVRAIERSLTSRPAPPVNGASRLHQP